MKVRFITLLNGKMELKQDLGIEILNQIMLDNGYDSECVNFFYDNKITYATSMEYAKYVCELGELPLLLKIIENYQNKRLIGEDVDKAIPIEFEVPQLQVFKEIDEHIDSLNISDDDIFCFNTTYISIVPMIYYALKILSINDSIRIIFGGYHVTLSKYTRDIILRLELGDVVVGDGASVILDVVNGKKRGLVYGVFPKNVRLPDYNDQKINICNGWITTITSFGCPNSCSFCSSDRQWTGFDMDYLESYHTKLVERYPNVKFYFADDNINMSIERFNSIADMLVKLNRPWRAFANPIQINGDIVRKLQQVPCDFVYLGAEGFSNEILKHLKKPGLTVSIVKAGISLLASHGIPVYLGLIVGMPGETNETFVKTDEACRELIFTYGNIRVDGGMLDIIPTAFKIFPNSQHYWNPEQYGISFQYWEDCYVNQIPEISDIVSKIPKTFSIDGQDFKWTRDKVMAMRDEYGIPTK